MFMTDLLKSSKPFRAVHALLQNEQVKDENREKGSIRKRYQEYLRRLI